MVMKRDVAYGRVMMVMGVAMFYLAGVGSASDTRDQPGSQGQPMDAATQAMMEAWQDYASPGDNHHVLNPLVGSWRYVAKWRMKPDLPPDVSKGISEIQWVMDGRYLLNAANGMPMGQPFEGMGITGFDNGKNVYQTIWIDNMGTGMIMGEGTYDPNKHTVTEHGHFTDPIVGQRRYRGVTTFIDDNHHSYEMYGTDETGKEFRMLEIVYTRETRRRADGQ